MGSEQVRCQSSNLKGNRQTRKISSAVFVCGSTHKAHKLDWILDPLQFFFGYEFVKIGKRHESGISVDLGFEWWHRYSLWREVQRYFTVKAPLLLRLQVWVLEFCVGRIWEMGSWGPFSFTIHARIQLYKQLREGYGYAVISNPKIQPKESDDATHPLL